MGNAMPTLAMAYLITGQRRYLDSARSVAELAQTLARIRKTANSGEFGYLGSALRQRPVAGLIIHCGTALLQVMQISA